MFVKLIEKLKTDRKKLVQQKIQRIKIQSIRQPGNNEQCPHRLSHPHGTAGAEQGQQSIQQIRHQYDIQIVRPLHPGQLSQKVLKICH